jgi:hypothetical protein
MTPPPIAVQVTAVFEVPVTVATVEKVELAVTVADD